MKNSAAAGIFTQQLVPSVRDLNPDILADRKVSISRSTRLSIRGMKRFIYLTSLNGFGRYQFLLAWLGGFFSFNKCRRIPLYISREDVQWLFVQCYLLG